MDTQIATAETAPVMADEKPGEKLRRVREEHGLSQEEIVIQLHLPINFLCALEADEVEKLPGLTFVRGYLRLYAKLLGLDPNEIIASFNILYPDMRERAPAPDRNYQRIVLKRKKQGGSSVKWIGYSIIVIMVILVLTWWQSRSTTNGSLSTHSVTASGFQSQQTNTVTDNSTPSLPGAASATPAVGPGVDSQMQMTTTNPLAAQVSNTVSNVPGLQADGNLTPAMAQQAEQKTVDVTQTTANAAAVPGLSSTPSEMTVVNGSSTAVTPNQNSNQQSQQLSVWRDPDTN